MSGEAPKQPIRVWCDGCFDMMHYGHANALRQAKAMGDYLIVGVHSDADITKNKGPPVMHEEERYKAVEACKWVDQVVRGAPYQTQLSVLEQYDVTFCVHGDDLVTTADGADCYAEVKAAGKFRIFPRTRGVSTTDMVGRMLLMTKDHHVTGSQIEASSMAPMSSPYTRCSQFIPSTRQINQFSEGREPKPGDKIVYIDGAFDLFHIGHILIIEKAKSLGDYLIVGIHSDQDVNDVKGANHPIMNLHERVLSALACRYVDEVIIGAPYVVTEELIRLQGIDLVVHGSESPVDPDKEGKDPYEAPKRLGKFQVIDSPCKLTTSGILERIIENRKSYEERNRKKEAKEVAEMK